MMNEVRFSSITTMGEPNIWVDLNTFIKLFVNHRPVYGIGKNNIDDAFKAILADSDDPGADALVREELVNLLHKEGDGEEVTPTELTEILQKLVSEPSIQLAFGGEHVTSESFAEDLLGFEEVDENEGEDDEDVEGAGGAASNYGGATALDNSKLGVIQEEI